MQYKVPQHVDIEDKVIGSLTVRQFIIVLIGIAIIGVLKVFLIGPLSIFFWPLTFIIGAFFGALAFAKYGDQNMEVFLLSAFKTFATPRKRVWKKEPTQTQNTEQTTPKPIDTEAPKETRIGIDTAEGGLAKLAEIVDSGGYSILEEQAVVTETPDILAKAESMSGDEVDKMLSEAARVTPKREQLVSEAASVSPNPKQAETPTIRLRRDQFYKEIR